MGMGQKATVLSKLRDAASVPSVIPVCGRRGPKANAASVASQEREDPRAGIGLMEVGGVKSSMLDPEPRPLLN